MTVPIYTAEIGGLSGVQNFPICRMLFTLLEAACH